MARIAREIPLSPQPQSFGIQLAGTQYRMTVRWNAAAACWVLDVADAARQPIVCGIPVVTGADLLGQYEYLGIGGGGMLVAQTDGDADAVPTFANLGTNGHLYFVAWED